MNSRQYLEALILQSPACPRNTIVTAAFSGGADSTALLLALYRLRETLQIDLRAVHVHHGIRGEEADRDAAFCAAFCERYGIPFQTVYADVPAYAAEKRLSTETAARILRYQALEKAAPAGDIAAAHHAGDNAETMLFHLMRGSGLKGLCGMAPRSGRLIRPLLEAQKDDILQYLRENQQDYIEDSTNFSDESTRNRIRHSLIPLMEQENHALLHRMSQTAELLSEDEAYLNAEAEQALTACKNSFGCLTGLSGYARPIRMRVYMLLLAALQIDPCFEKLREIDELLTKAGKITVSGDVYAQADRGMLYIGRPAQTADFRVPLVIGENRPVADRICRAVLTEAGGLSRNVHKGDTKSTLDFDKITGIAYFRQRQTADTIRLPGRSFDSNLKKCVQTLPQPIRQRLHVLYDDLGCIYCEGVGIAARVKPDGGTGRLLILESADAACSGAFAEETLFRHARKEGVNDT